MSMTSPDSAPDRSVHTGRFGEIAEGFRKTAVKILSRGPGMRTVNLLVETASAFADTAYADVKAETEEPDKIACAKGCTYCCTLMVPVTAAEVFCLLEHLEKDLEDEDLARFRRRLNDTYERTRAMSSARRYIERPDCPALEHGGCVGYAARPLACRGFTSLSWLACLRDYKLHRSGRRTPILFNRTGVYSAVRDGMLTAFEEVGIRPQMLELTGALHIAGGAENAVERWFAGEDLFDAAVLRM